MAAAEVLHRAPCARTSILFGLHCSSAAVFVQANNIMHCWPPACLQLSLPIISVLASSFIEYDQPVRLAAVAAYLFGERDISKAIPKFRELCERERLQCPQRPGCFIERWGKRWLQQHSLNNKRGRGRHSKLSRQLVDDVVDRFTDGYPGHARKVYYTSFRAALEWDHELSAMVDSSGVTPETFWLHMLEVRGASSPRLPACAQRGTACNLWHTHLPLVLALATGCSSAHTWSRCRRWSSLHSPTRSRPSA